MRDVIGGRCDVVERLVSDDAVDGADAGQTVRGADAIRHQSDQPRQRASLHSRLGIRYEMFFTVRSNARVEVSVN